MQVFPSKITLSAKLFSLHHLISPQFNLFNTLLFIGCFHETAYLKDNTADLRTPVLFELKLQLQQDEPRRPKSLLGGNGAVSNINYYPILNQQEATKLLKVKFQESCGHDEVCSSKLQASLSLGPGFESVKNRLEIQYRQEIQLNVSVSNLGEPAYSAELQVNIDPSFAYVGRSDDVSDIHCDFRGRGLGVGCKLGNPYASNRSDVLLFRVVPSQSSPFVQTGALFSVSVNTSSEDVGTELDRMHNLEVCVLLIFKGYFWVLVKVILYILKFGPFWCITRFRP